MACEGNRRWGTKAAHHPGPLSVSRTHHESGPPPSQLPRLLWPQPILLMSTIGHMCWELPIQVNNEQHAGPGHKVSRHPRTKRTDKAPRSTGSRDREVEHPLPRGKRNTSSLGHRTVSKLRSQQPAPREQEPLNILTQY